MHQNLTDRVNNLHYEKFQDGTVKCIEDEIPFEVPEGWAWTRISTVAIFIGGYAYKSSKYIPDSQNILIRIGNIKNNKITPLIAKTCISDEYAAETGNYLIRENDILFTMTGTRGKSNTFQPDNQMLIKQETLIAKNQSLIS